MNNEINNVEKVENVGMETNIIVKEGSQMNMKESFSQKFRAIKVKKVVPAVLVGIICFSAGFFTNRAVEGTGNRHMISSNQGMSGDFQGRGDGGNGSFNGGPGNHRNGGQIGSNVQGGASSQNGAGKQNVPQNGGNNDQQQGGTQNGSNNGAPAISGNSQNQ